MSYEVKADALEASFDAHELPPMEEAVVRPVLSAAGRAGDARGAFVDGYLRRGLEGEIKSFNAVVAGEGGYALPREIDVVIDTTLKAISPIRAVANVVRVGTAGYRKLVTQNGVASGWAAENAARPETGTPTFNEIAPPMGDLYANPSGQARVARLAIERRSASIVPEALSIAHYELAQDGHSSRPTIGHHRKR